VFGLITLILVVVPALIFMRRSPEEMGLKPDGGDDAASGTGGTGKTNAEADARAKRRSEADTTLWTWQEVIRTRTFWTVCFIYGMVNIGIAGLNLHVFAYVTDIGFSTIVAATVLSIIASTQLGSTLVWGFVSERLRIRYSTVTMFLVQTLGLSLVLASDHVAMVYAGFFFYGIGLGGGWVLQELIWATYFGRVSLGLVRGLGTLVTHAFGAAGAPFFGFIHDVTGSYQSSFLAFVLALVLSAGLTLTIRAPRKKSAAA
jgi:sugar phosphate permease